MYVTYHVPLFTWSSPSSCPIKRYLLLSKAALLESINNLLAIFTAGSSATSYRSRLDLYFSDCHKKSPEVNKIKLRTFTPLNPKSDQHQISPCDFNALLNRVVTRIEDRITQHEFRCVAWSLFQVRTSGVFITKSWLRASKMLKIETIAKNFKIFCSLQVRTCVYVYRTLRAWNPGICFIF